MLQFLPSLMIPMLTRLSRSSVWLYWHEGARSSAHAQFEHLTSLERADGVDHRGSRTSQAIDLP